MAYLLILGGTTEATHLAAAVSQGELRSVFSYAGRTGSRTIQPLPTRVGGFGGVEGLVKYLREERVTHVIDATHPFADKMSRNAVSACTQANVPLLALERKPWEPKAGDCWTLVPTMAHAVEALPDAASRVFLAIGKKTIATFAAKPQHHYLLRLVDPPELDLPLQNVSTVIARGPFDVAGDSALLRDNAITHLVAKNAGGAGAEAKLTAARHLRIPVILVDRPTLPSREIRDSVSGAMDWLASHGAILERGV